MYDVIRDVINTQRYVLADMLHKIDTLWAQGDLDDEQRTELIALARDKADMAQEVNVLARLEELEQRVRTLEDGSTEPGESYPDYVVGKWYYSGDKITFEGGKYKCIAPDGVVCVWSPKEYPVYWELVV